MFSTSLKKRLVAFLIAGVLMISGTATAFAANADGGVWDYGTYVSGLNEKTVYSNYYHSSKIHKSSVSIGTTAVTSGWVAAGDTSYASATGTWSAETHAYYDYK